MILGLTALGEGRMPLRTRVETAASHALAAAAGGALIAFLLWLAATPVRTLLPSPVALSAVVATAVVAIGIDTRLLRGASKGRQVPGTWLRRYGPQRAYALYGLRFGMAFTTLRPFAVIYVLFVALAVLVSLPVAMLCGALFGFGRTAIVGPASFGSVVSSKFLYHGVGVRRIWATISVALTVVLVLMATQAS